MNTVDFGLSALSKIGVGVQFAQTKKCLKED